MLRILNVVPGTWAQITRDAKALISDQRFAQSGAWHLWHVRVDLPLPLALDQQHKILGTWLSEQSLSFLITGVRRTDIALHLCFRRP